MSYGCDDIGSEDDKCNKDTGDMKGIRCLCGNWYCDYHDYMMIEGYKGLKCIYYIE